MCVHLQAPESLNPALHEYKYLTRLSQWVAGGGGFRVRPTPQNRHTGMNVDLGFRSNNLSHEHVQASRCSLSGSSLQEFRTVSGISRSSAAISVCEQTEIFPFVFHLFLTPSPAAVAQFSRTRPTYRGGSFDVI